VVPCVGVSIGVERVFAIMEAAAAKAAGGAGLKRTPVSVLVASIPSKRRDMTLERMRLCGALWRAGVSAEMSFTADPKLQKQVAAAAEAGVPLMVVLGEDELDRGEVQVKDMAARTAVNVPLPALVDTVRRILLQQPSQPVAAPQEEGAPAAAPSAPSVAASGSCGRGSSTNSLQVTVEGADRRVGRFSRPAAPIL
jgi:hypothetical protein